MAAVLALAMTAAFFAYLQAPALAAGGDAIDSHAVTGDREAALDYWTPRRMRAAEPLEAPGAPETQVAPQAAGAGPSPTASASALSPDTEVPASLASAYPYRIHGRLFFRYGSDDASCSATVVTARSRNVILTAGHCVALPLEGGEPIWATNVVFAPAYRDGATPYGTYAGTMLRAPVLWTFENDLTFDVGAINLAPGAGGQIQDVLGSRGVAFNRPPGRYRRNRTRFKVFGYPAAPAASYNGQRLIECDVPFKAFESFTLALAVAPCNMKEGSSGGGFVLSGGLVKSVVSHNGCGTDPSCTVIAGTHFGNAAFKLWSKAAGGLTKGRRKRLRECRKKRGGKKSVCVSRAQTFKPVRS